MNFNNIVKSFVPKDKIFYSLFEEMGESLLLMGKTLQSAIYSESTTERNKLLTDIETLEHRNDDITHAISVELSRNFITPFDREDIHELSKALDDVADFMHSAANRIVLYNITKIDEYIKGFVDINLQTIEVLSEAIKELRSLKKVNKLAKCCVEINTLESKADKLFDNAIGNLFSGKFDQMDVIKYKDIYEELEIVTDKCEDASDVIESILVKYA